MIDRAIFNRQIAVMSEMHRHVLSGPTIDEYYLLLSPRMTTEQFVKMARRIEMSTGGFWPKPAEFLPPVSERLGTDQLAAEAKREGLTSGATVKLLPTREGAA